ncbi:hypothetical protein HID58_049310 [Brassica napus]|uniref:Protein-serine/threonine phosphatase n=1 Tax=Brassica napus TaxID=3708 RepID=A0ABQ8B4M1_BRANA|nr:hypothetical protein HID58_049310 [Brassica napus]
MMLLMGVEYGDSELFVEFDEVSGEYLFTNQRRTTIPEKASAFRLSVVVDSDTYRSCFRLLLTTPTEAMGSFIKQLFFSLLDKTKGRNKLSCLNKEEKKKKKKKKMEKKKKMKLHLVLDLDQTLLHYVPVSQLSDKEKYIMQEPDSRVRAAKRDLRSLSSMAEAEMDPKEVPADPPPVIRLGGKSWGNVDTEIVQIALEKDKRGHDEVMSLSGGSKERTSLVEGTSKESILEDGEINEWKKVSGEVRRTPKPQSLKYDQESIATPFRFAALSNTNEKGEAIATEDIEESEEVGTEEEEDIFQSRIEDSVEARW